MAFHYETEQDGIAVTGYDGPVSHLQVPERLDGLPVRAIRKSSFARRNELLTVHLPESLHTLERFAFYACPQLAKVTLGGNISDLGDGVFRQCGALCEFEMNLEGGDFTILKEVLAENDRNLRVFLHLPQGEACLHFPDYLLEFEEDTWARVLHTKIEGAGFAYRECVTRKGIDFRGYDQAFTRIRRNDLMLAGKIALDRLCFPVGMEAKAETVYEEFLRENAVPVMRLTVETGEERWLRFLLDRDLADREAVREGIRLASEKRKASFVALLMSASPKKEQKGRFQL